MDKRPANPKHDLSTWKQTVVGTDEFAPAPKASKGWIWIVAIVVVAGGAAAVLALR
jgi:hypothetical protein